MREAPIKREGRTRFSWFRGCSEVVPNWFRKAEPGGDEVILDSSDVPRWFRTGSELVPSSGTGVPLDGTSFGGGSGSTRSKWCWRVVFLDKAEPGNGLVPFREVFVQCDSDLVPTWFRVFGTDSEPGSEKCLQNGTWFRFRLDKTKPGRILVPSWFRKNGSLSYPLFSHCNRMLHLFCYYIAFTVGNITFEFYQFSSLSPVNFARYLLFGTFFEKS